MTTRELLLLRHGKSDWSTDADDFYRPLVKRGIQGAQRIGTWLAQQALTPDLIISSTAVRAHTTAEFAVNAMGISTQQIQLDDKLYLADLKQLLEIVTTCPATSQRVMLVGHNPGLEELLCYLASDITIPDDGKLLPTATLARLSMPRDWRTLHKGCAQLLTLRRAKTLPATFPYPDIRGSEQREQPAYYYQQASALPYRFSANGGLEFLLIRSRKDKHWIIPKGIQAPGVSARDTAAQEAREEAGIDGEVAEHAIATYEYQKWGGYCTVQVFPLQVTQVLTEDDWPEHQRGREWTDAETASKRIQHKALRPLFSQLSKQLQG